MEQILEWLFYILEMPIKDLHNVLQNLHPKIKFTIKHNSKEQQFLDIIIKNQNGQIIIDIYHKPSDIEEYSNFKSSHLKNCIKSIACRICTIVTNKNLWQTCLEELRITLY